MKKYITFQQWDEISKEQKNRLWDNGFKRDWQMSIGDMVEFLEDDFRIDTNIGHSKWYVEGIGMELEIGSNLCDLLWEAVKFKLFNLTV